MIQLIFEHLNEKVIVIVDGTNIRFGSTSQGAFTANIDGLKLNRNGVIKEHPDLKDRDDWRIEAIKRFKEKIKSFDSEDKRASYIIEDLRKHNYVPQLKQVKGHRPRRIL